MNNISTFDFNSKELRVINDNWFVAADVCKALDLSNPTRAVSGLDDDEKTTLTNSKGRAGKGAQSFNCVNESGLYHLIFKSRKKEAKTFRKWVTSEVLPAIRKTGTYTKPVKTLTPAQQRHIQKRVSAIVHAEEWASFPKVWSGVKDKFNVGTYKDIPQSAYPSLCAYLNCKPLEGELLPNLNDDFERLTMNIAPENGVKRLFVVIERDEITNVSSLEGKNIVNAVGYKKLRGNLDVIRKQMRWLDGDADSSILESELIAMS